LPADGFSSGAGMQGINDNTLIPRRGLISTFTSTSKSESKEYPQFQHGPDHLREVVLCGCMTAPCKAFTRKTDDRPAAGPVRLSDVHRPYQWAQLSTRTNACSTATTSVRAYTTIAVTESDTNVPQVAGIVVGPVVAQLALRSLRNSLRTLRCKLKNTSKNRKDSPSRTQSIGRNVLVPEPLHASCPDPDKQVKPGLW